MEHIKKTILVSTPFTMSPTEWYGKFIEDVKSSPDLASPDLIRANVKMIENVDGGVKMVDVTKLYPYAFKECFELDSNFDLILNDTKFNAFLTEYGFPMQVI